MTSDQHPEFLRVRLDAIDEALLGTLAQQNGLSIEEQAARLLGEELERIAREFNERHSPDRRRHQ